LAGAAHRRGVTSAARTSPQTAGFMALWEIVTARRSERRSGEDERYRPRGEWEYGNRSGRGQQKGQRWRLSTVHPAAPRTPREDLRAGARSWGRAGDGASRRGRCRGPSAACARAVSDVRAHPPPMLRPGAGRELGNRSQPGPGRARTGNPPGAHQALQRDCSPGIAAKKSLRVTRLAHPGEKPRSHVRGIQANRSHRGDDA
jgi:hypothetical protein